MNQVSYELESRSFKVDQHEMVTKQETLSPPKFKKYYLKKQFHEKISGENDVTTLHSQQSNQKSKTVKVKSNQSQHKSYNNFSFIIVLSA